METPRNVEAPSRGVLFGITPFAILTAVVMFLFFDQRGWDAAGIVFESVLVIICVCLILSTINVAAFWWAPRVVAFIIFAAYLSYVIFEVFLSDKPFALPRSQGEANPVNAIMGFCIFGIPCLLYSLSGSTIGPIAAKPGEAEPTRRELMYLSVAFSARWVLIGVSVIVVVIGLWRAFAS